MFLQFFCFLFSETRRQKYKNIFYLWCSSFLFLQAGTPWAYLKQGGIDKVKYINNQLV